MKKSIVLTMVLVLLVGVFSFSFACDNIQAQEVIHGRFLEYSFIPNETGQIVTVLKLVDDVYNEYEFYYHISFDELQDWVMYDYYFEFDTFGEVESIQVIDIDVMGNEILICDN